jgi:protein TonB
METIVNQELARREELLRRRAEEERRRLERELEASRAREKAPAPAPEERVVAAVPAPSPTAQTPVEPAAQAPSAATESAPPPVAAPSPRIEPVPEEPARVEPVPAPAPETPAEPRTRPGDLVQPGPGVTPPQLVSYDKPKYPPMAQQLRVQGVVVIALLVDENGRVQDARVAEPIRQDVGINEAALAAARTARYRPATKEGVPVKIWTRLRIPFKL